MTLLLNGLRSSESIISKSFGWFLFLYNCAKEQKTTYNFNFLVFVLMEVSIPDHIHISYFQEEQFVRRIERQRFWSRKDAGITEFLLDSAKIRTLQRV